MKKFLLSLCVLTINTFFAQNLISQNFDVVPVVGWTTSNLSTTVGTTDWFQGTSDFPAFAGAVNSYIGVNFNSTTGANTISNWLFTPTVSLQNNDVISFYSRTVDAPAYADRLEMRIGVGATPAAPAGATGVGGYTTLAVQINPTLTTSGYPNIWTQYSYTVTGLPAATDCKVAFRYFVTNGGPTGANSDFIGIDSFAINRPLSTDTFFKSNFSIAPNPANDLVTISKNSAIDITSVTVTDINGRIVKEINNDATTINVADLNAGVYFLKINTTEGSGTTKLIKN